MQRKRFKGSSTEPPDTSGVHIWLILMKAFHSVSKCVEHDVRPSGLGDTDFRVLEALLHKGPMPVNTIGPKVFLTPGSISVAIDRLLDKGLVTRTDNKSDRRVRVVDLTTKGRGLIDRVFQAHARSMEELASVLAAEERLSLVVALRKFGKWAMECEGASEE